MSQIKGLVQKRKCIHSKIKKLYEIAVKASADNASEDIKKNFFVRYESLFEDISKFESFHFEIIGLIEEGNIEEQDEIFEAFNEMQFSIKSLYKDLFEKANNVKDDQIIKGNSTSISGKSDRCDRVRLPKIEIPKFDGDIKKWPTFYDMFRSLIHECDSLTNIERFQFLVSYLEGHAASVIKNIPITEANYETAYNALVKRYQNDRILVTDYWLSIYHAPNIKSKSAYELRKLLSTFSENIAALDLFKVDMWDFTKFNLLFQKVDTSLKTLFEVEYSNKSFPEYKDLFSFLEKHCKALENSQLLPKGDCNNVSHGKGVDGSKRSGHSSGNPGPAGYGGGASGHNKSGRSYNFLSRMDNAKCLFCGKGDHSLIKCDGFLCADVSARHSFIKTKRLCFNCFGSNHSLDKCENANLCQMCQKKHHTLLHFPSKQKGGSNSDNQVEVTSGDSGLKVYSSSVTCQPLQRRALFATALVHVWHNGGKIIKCRAMVDSASQANFISASCVRRLGIQPSKSSTPIQGLNQMSSCATLGDVSLKFSPCASGSTVYDLNAIVLSRICDAIPANTFSCQKWKYLKNLNLADPEFNSSADVDILFGVEVFSQIIIPGLLQGQNGGPCALNTTLGWILFGSIESLPIEEKILSCFTSVNGSLDVMLRRFWELECVPKSNHMPPDDSSCENHFQRTCKRTTEGRYIVQLPFRSFPPALGDSKAQALRRFKLLEGRLERNPELKVLYYQFMNDYLEQGHMTLAEPLDCLSDGYFVPHHGVVKGEGENKKIRVVFDASAQSSNGASLNDCLFAGPKLQKDIISILLNFRIYSVVFTTDIRQMYRQILVAEEHRDFQRILFRFSSHEQVKEYRLNTVTYGVSSSPYLAIRSLMQLANDHGKEYPLAAKILKETTYVDDVIGLASSVPEALEMQRQLIELLSLGCFELRKWSSNCSALLKNVPVDHRQIVSFSEKEVTGMKILGLQWSPVSDCFSYSVTPLSRECTKRNILSEIARIYDPLGFFAPTILVAKILIQHLWIQGVDWDTVLSGEISHKWEMYLSQLPFLSVISIPRRFIANEALNVEVHGFCDASEVGYGAVLYLRQVLPDNKVFVSLVCAKTRVSPLKRISLPRLELCAATLLAECFEFVLSNLSSVKIERLYAWSDSTVTLAWIRSSPYRWKTFIANRVSQIQDKVPPDCWRYVDGKVNPADCASRGVMPEELASHPLWWAGPPWLLQDKAEWPCRSLHEIPEEAAEEERKIVCISTCSSPFFEELLRKYSSLPKIQRIVAYCIRFLHNARVRKSSRHTEVFSYNDLYSALVVIVSVVQRQVFGSDYEKIKQNLPCSKPLQKLAPFIDESGVIRVGGRLKHANLAYSAKHPMLLPRCHPLTDLIILHFHNENLHPGPRTLQYLIMQQFWILSSRRAIRHVLSKCYRCFRLKPSSLTPFMSDLPPARVSQVKAFAHCGVDFAGPLSIVLGRHRGVRSQKAYICVFVCLSTKALHLEAVSDLSAEAFLAALRRFVARRGRCSDLYSDRGTNFVGANNLLSSYCQQSSEMLAIRWHFNPPASPHWGGIWESAVRSVKTHLLRVIGCQILTFEELTTLLAQIEALLNSRPLCSVSPDPNDLNSLTPGHFLTVEPLTAPPDEDFLNLNSNRLNRWQLVQQLHQHFWKRWRLEYLHTLQQRAKWNCHQQSPAIGTMVVLKDEHCPPLKWSLGRIVRLYPSPDNIVRVAQVRTIKGLIDRPLVKLCPLPSQ